MLKVLHHLFLPHQHNNHKAKILWTRSLLILVGLFVMGRSIVDITIGLRPGILGYASQIDVGKIVEYTNQNRIKSGAEKVTLNAQLNAAAAAKVDDMFKENYWAHVSPKGTEPWTFISNAGYKYQHAGENLARDFSNSKDVVNAWMNSPSHKKNLLDKRYKDMGLAVKDGYLNGVESSNQVKCWQNRGRQHFNKRSSCPGRVQAHCRNLSPKSFQGVVSLFCGSHPLRLGYGLDFCSAIQPYPNKW